MFDYEVFVQAVVIYYLFVFVLVVASPAMLRHVSHMVDVLKSMVQR